MDQLRKIRRHHWKERIKISKIDKFESDTPKASEDIASRSCENLQTFLWGAWGGGMPTLRSYLVISFQQMTFELDNRTNLKALFPAVLTDFP